MSQFDPTLSFLSSPEIHVSGLVYFFLGVILCPTSWGCTSPPAEHNEKTKSSHADTSRLNHSVVQDVTKPSRPVAHDITLDSKVETYAVPTGLVNLKVPGFHTAVYAGPDPSAPKPWRLTVVLHGNYDRPEWQCETWKQVAGFYGFTLCPRGVPTHFAPKSEDRWMYRGSKRTLKEIDAAISALKQSHPNQFVTDKMILVGFSLGAILSPGILNLAPGRFETLFLIEGMVDKINKRHLMDMKRAGVRGLGLAMSCKRYRDAAKQVEKWSKKVGIDTVFVNMKGAGHNYHPDFPTMGRKALYQLLKQNDFR